MNAATATPELDALYKFIGRVKRYPVSVSGLVAFARRSDVPAEIVDFYKSFNPDIVFSDKDELITRSEQVDIMRGESSDMPREEERSTDEY